jgi:hypothetical protein
MPKPEPGGRINFSINVWEGTMDEQDKPMCQRGPVQSSSKLSVSSSAPVDLDAILTDRGKKYGPFHRHATVTQRLKELIDQYAEPGQFTDDQQEALDMICHKIGRIVNGDPNYVDNWDDIAGYAKLVADRLRGITR